MTFSRILLIQVFICLLFCFVPSQASGAADVSVHLNGFYNKAFIGADNVLEFWIKNDDAVKAFSTGFQFSSAALFNWVKPYGDKPIGLPLMKREPAIIGYFDLDGTDINTNKMDGTSPDSFVIFGIALGNLTALPSHASSVLCFTMKFFIPAEQSPVLGGICIDNILFPPGGTWTFNDTTGSHFAPAFQGNPNTSETTPDAPPICFDIVYPCRCGDANHDGSTAISDAVFIIQWIFNSGARPTPLCYGDTNGDCMVNISDAISLIVYIFQGGPAPAGSCNACTYTQ